MMYCFAGDPKKSCSLLHATRDEEEDHQPASSFGTIYIYRYKAATTYEETNDYDLVNFNFSIYIFCAYLV